MYEREAVKVADRMLLSVPRCLDADIDIITGGCGQVLSSQTFRVLISIESEIDSIHGERRIHSMEAATDYLDLLNEVTS